jgi:AAA domain
LRIPASRASDKQLDLFDTERLRPQTSTLARSGIKKSVKPAPDAIHPSAPMTSLPTIRAAQLADVQDSVPEWMIEGLWGAEAVGVIGGEPKQGKTFLALDMAIAVASGAPCLRYFPTRRAGPVLLYAAEDSHRVLCQRLQGIAAAAGVDFETLDIHIIATPTLRIDRVDQQRALRATVAQLRPALLSLDPLVRLHAGDENVSREIAALLGYLRSLQREFHTAVVLVHHARKNAAHERGGQALRGSSDLHAWGDSNIYVRRNSKGSYLDIEHRAAPGTDKLPLELVAEPPVLGFRVVEQPHAPSDDSRSPLERVQGVLAAAPQPVTQRQLRQAVRMRASLVADVLEQLIADGRVSRGPDGYCLTS